MQRGNQGKFLKNRPKSSPRLKGPKALWRTWHYPVISILFKRKDWVRFWRKTRLKECPDCQVMAIFSRSPKTRIFWKSAKRGTREISQKSPKKSPRLKGPKALWRKSHYPVISMLLTCKDWTRFLLIRRLQKCPNGQVMAIFARSPEPAFSKKVQRGNQGKILEKKVALA